jgi:hypothetical protein
MRRLVPALILAALTTACGASGPASSVAPSTGGTTAVTAQTSSRVTETFTGTISGGDRTSCVWDGVPPHEVTNVPCSVFPVTAGAGGALMASLTFGADQSLLRFRLYDPVQHETVANGTLQTDSFPTYQQVLSSNIQPGTYELQVSVITSSLITPFTVIVAHPR